MLQMLQMQLQLSLTSTHRLMPPAHTRAVPACNRPGASVAGSMAATTTQHSALKCTPCRLMSKNQKWCHTNQPPAARKGGAPQPEEPAVAG
jgi:hypothetical protein